MQRTFRLILVTAALTASFAPAEALTIRLIDIGTNPMTLQQFVAFRQAARIWEDRLSDPITVTINIAWSPPATFRNNTILGSTNSARTSVPYAAAFLGMAIDADSDAERASVSQFPPRLQVADINGMREAQRVTLSTANGKALRLSSGLDPVYGAALPNNADATIRYNTTFAAQFDLNRSDGINAGQFDFVGVAAHEIGHALGFFGLADVQDGSPGFVLFPNTLDLWRFAQTGGAHNIQTETRPLTAGATEYYDRTAFNNTQFSQGLGVVDPSCNAMGSICQASHWRDNLGFMMDPSVARGVLVNPFPADVHSLDYIGYDPIGFRLPRSVIDRILIGFYDISRFTDPPGFGGRFLDFADPPDEGDMEAATGSKIDELIKTSNANVALRVGLDLGAQGKGRSGLGLARFEPVTFNPNATVVEVPLPDGQWEDLSPPNVPMIVIPPRLTSFLFVSDKSKGTPFVFRALIPEHGAHLDGSLGKHGGFRLGGWLDGTGDGQIGDVDGWMTVVVLAEEMEPESKIEDLVFTLDQDSIDSTMEVVDPKAIGYLPARIDIVPGKDDNTTRRLRPFPLAILSAPGLSAPDDVDLGSLRFGRNGDEKSLWRCSSPRDVNGDGSLDLLCYFRGQLAGFGAGEFEGILTGLTKDGIPLEGKDVLWVLR